MEIVAVGSAVVGATILALRGDTEARTAVGAAVHGIDLPASRSLHVRTHYALGAAALAEGDHAAAYTRFRAVDTQDAEPEPVHFHASPYYLADLTAAAVRTGHADEARRIVDATRRRLGSGAVSARLDAVLHRAEALLGEGDETEDHFTAALADPDGEQWLFERRRSASTTRSGCAADAARWRPAPPHRRARRLRAGRRPPPGPNALARTAGQRRHARQRRTA